MTWRLRERTSMTAGDAVVSARRMLAFGLLAVFATPAAGAGRDGAPPKGPLSGPLPATRRLVAPTPPELPPRTSSSRRSTWTSSA